MSDLEVQVEIELSAPDQTLVDLIEKVGQGDEEALGLLYDKTSSYVYGLAIRVLNDPSMAEEVSLDVYLQIWKQANQFDVSRGKPIVWLAVLARSRAIDRLRVGQKEREGRQSLDVIGEQAATCGNPEESTEYNQQCRVVHQALTAISPEQRQVIEMAYFSGMTQSEISAKIGEPLGTVKTRVRLGMIKLRNILGSLEEELVS